MTKAKAVVSRNHEQRAAFVPQGMRPKRNDRSAPKARHCYGVQVTDPDGKVQLLASGLVRSAAEACVFCIQQALQHGEDMSNPVAIDEGTVEAYRTARGLPVKGKEED
jgi:hypothetical protein